MSTQHPEAILEARDISFSYGGPRVWDGVSLMLRSGETAVLVGVNGAGKSTLLRCLAGWAPPDSGEILFQGERLDGADRSFRGRLVLVNDTPPFYDDLTAEEHVRFVLRANRMGQREADASRLLEEFGLLGQKGEYPSSFSRGMRYKLALALALALEPALLLLDEPFGPLDPLSAGVLARELGSAAARGAAVLLSSHRLPYALAPDTFLTLEGGRLRTSPAGGERPRSGSSGEDELAELLRASAAEEQA